MRYVDDIFIIYNNIKQTEDLKNKFEEESLIKFTVEHSTNNKLPFLDVMIEKYKSDVFTQVHCKKIDFGLCLNAFSESPVR